MRRRDRAVTETGELLGMLARCKICHLAFPTGGAPYVLPMNFGFDLEKGILTLYFHCAKEGYKLQLLQANPEVGFAIDREIGEIFHEQPCRSGCYYESVIGAGRAEILTDTEEKRVALTRLMAHQFGKEIDFSAEQAESVCVFRVVSSSFCAKRKES